MGIDADAVVWYGLAPREEFGPLQYQPDWIDGETWVKIDNSYLPEEFEELGFETVAYGYCEDPNMGFAVLGTHDRVYYGDVARIKDVKQKPNTVEVDRFDKAMKELGFEGRPSWFVAPYLSH